MLNAILNEGITSEPLSEKKNYNKAYGYDKISTSDMTLPELMAHFDKLNTRYGKKQDRRLKKMTI